MSSPWRRVFDAFEGPISAASQSWVQSETFMDLAASTFKLQRRLLGALQNASERPLHALGIVSRGDLTRLVNQVASLERHVRELERPDRPADGGTARSEDSRTRPRTTTGA